MDYTTFLPDHIIVDIFDSLTPKTIKRCSLVCKRWDKIISNSIWLMEYFWLCVDKGECEKLKESKRKHQMIMILNEIGESLDVICQRNLLDLELKNIKEVVDSWKFLNLLKKLPQLETLSALIDLSDVDVPDDMKVQINRLEYLKCKVGMSRLLNVTSIYTLQVTFDADFSSDDFINFLKQQKNLKELSINGSFDQKLFQNPEFLKLNCRLTSFRFMTNLPFLFHYEFIKFLQIQQDTLKSLWMHWTGNSYEIVKRFVLKEMKNLEQLFMSFTDWILFEGDGSKIENYLAISLLPEQFRKPFRDFFPTPPIAVAVKNIQNIYCVLPNNHESNKQLIKTLKNVKKFRLDSSVMNESFLKETLEYISKVMIDLEKLEVHEISSTALYFSKLKELVVDLISFTDIFIDFVRRHSATLESIKIREIIDISPKTVEELMKCKNLMHLEIESNIADYRSLNACSLTDELFILKIEYNNSFFKFIFPDDKLEWDAFISTIDNES